jgi:8-oxo-dGTP diphosphatase
VRIQATNKSCVLDGPGACARIMKRTASQKRKAQPTLVAAGIIMRKGRVLVCQRNRHDPFGLQWEFPGGKVEPTETLKESLRRELAEELSIEAQIGPEVFRFKHHYADRFVEVVFFQIPAYRGTIRNRVFEALEWTPRHKLPEYNFLEPDRELVSRIARGEIV